MSEKEIIFYRESMLYSVVSDVVTFTVPAIFAWFNYQYLGNSTIFQIMIALVFFLIAVSRGSKRAKRFHNREALLGYLQQPQQEDGEDE